MITTGRVREFSCGLSEAWRGITRFARFVGVMLMLAQSAAWGQAADAAPSTPPLGGPQVLSVSAYGAFYSHGLPETGTVPQGNVSNLPPDVGAGGSIAFGWTRFTERTTFSLSYVPSYTGDFRYSSLNALNHAVSFNVSRHLTPHWILGFSASAGYTTQEQFLFAPSALSNVASVPASFDQLSSGLLTGNFSGNQPLGVALTTAAPVQSPITSLLYGQRMFTVSGQSTLSHSFSPRLSVTFGGGGSRSQYASPGQTSAAGNGFLLADTTSGNGTASLSYSLSPVSQVGATTNTNWISSAIERIITTTTMATFGRTFSQHWVLQVHGGVAVTSPLRGSITIAGPTFATAADPAFGGSLAFKTTAHTLLASLEHAASDSYGLGASSTNTANFTWQWHRPGRLWALQGDLSWQELKGGALSQTSGWHAGAGVSRHFGPHFSILWQYTYLKYSGGLQRTFYSYAESAVRVSTIWTPRGSSLR